MAENNDWKPYRWYCVNCGHPVQGFKNKEGRIRVECARCHSVMIRVPKSRRRDDFYVMAPKLNTGVTTDGSG